MMNQKSKIQRIDLSDLPIENGVLLIKDFESVHINTTKYSIVSRIVIKDCGTVYLDGNDLLFVINNEEVNPVHCYNSSNVGLEGISVLNMRDTISVYVAAMCSLNKMSIRGGKTGVYLNHEKGVVRNSKILDQTCDGIFIANSDCAVYNNTIGINGKLILEGLHPDAIQMAGKATEENVLYKIYIAGNIIKTSSPHDCQGIMHSDGLLVDSVIDNNLVGCRNSNGIRINRANSVFVTRNHTETDIYIGSTKVTELESNSNTITDNTCRNLYTYNIGDSVVKDNSFIKG